MQASGLRRGSAADGVRCARDDCGAAPEEAIQPERHQPAEHRRPQVVRQEMGAAQLLADAEDDAHAKARRQPEPAQLRADHQEEEVDRHPGVAAAGVARREAAAVGQPCGPGREQFDVWPHAAQPLDIPGAVHVRPGFDPRNQQRRDQDRQRQIAQRLAPDGQRLPLQRRQPRRQHADPGGDAEVVAGAMQHGFGQEGLLQHPAVALPGVQTMGQRPVELQQRDDDDGRSEGEQRQPQMGPLESTVCGQQGICAPGRTNAAALRASVVGRGC